MSSGRKLRVPRAMVPGAGGNRCIISLTVDIDFPLTADWAKAFSFDTLNLYSSGTAIAIPGASQVASVFSMARIHKVEMSIIPAATGLDYTAQTLSSGVTNIPYVYTAIDYDDNDTPSIAELQNNATCKVVSLNKIIKTSCYPRLEGSNGIIDVGMNRKSIFMKTGAASTQKWHGIKVYIDCANEVWTYGGGRVSFKVYFECMQSK